jgi:hypothetical protein
MTLREGFHRNDRPGIHQLAPAMVGSVLCLPVFAFLPSLSVAQEQRETRKDASEALGETGNRMKALREAAGMQKSFVSHKEHRVRPVPLPKQKKAVPAALEPAAAAAPLKPSPVILGKPFDGVGKSLNYPIEHAPPDTNGSVGDNEYVQWVNQSFAVFDKAGHLKLGPTDGSALWHGFGGNCEHSNDGDPITLYDKAAKRWVMTQFAVSNGPPYSQCIAVSQSSDPLGAYYRYEYQFSDFNDYPKLGVWPDGYYASFNMFHGDTFQGAKICAFDRAQMLVGASAQMKCFDLPQYAGVLPADVDGQAQPPVGSPNYVIGFGDNELNLWRVHVNWASINQSTISGPIVIPVAPFTPACGGGDCIPQPGTGQQLSSLADRMMYRLAYRKFADHESLVVNHTVKSGAGAAIRWYEIRDPAKTPTVYQQGTYAPDSLYRWMGSIAMDKNGDILMGYSASSAKRYPSVRVAGRLATDPLNRMSAEKTAVVGKGSQKVDLDRWGDYSSVSVDPADDCTFWFTTEYLDQSGTFNWNTSVFSARFPSCK